MSPSMCNALNLSRRLSAAGGCPKAAHAVLINYGNQQLRHALECLEQATPVVTDALVERLHLLPLDNIDTENARRCCGRLVDASAKMSRWMFEVERMAGDEVFPPESFPSMFHVDALLLNSMHSASTPLIKLFFGTTDADARRCGPPFNPRWIIGLG